MTLPRDAKLCTADEAVALVQSGWTLASGGFVGAAHLIEVAPGIDVETQVVANMQFRPVIRQLRPMPAHVFAVE